MQPTARHEVARVACLPERRPGTQWAAGARVLLPRLRSARVRV